MTTDVKDFYESERKAAAQVAGMLQRKYAGVTNMADADVQRRFINEAKGVYAENGLIATVEMTWQDPDDPEKFSPTASDDETDMNLYWLPRIVVIGRVDKLKEYDHDKQSHEVKAGVFDGKAGVIDINTGLLKEDSKKKNIY
jgi:metal-dependent amidase/aminoacylase/carboxypeptidase family protein